MGFFSNLGRKIGGAAESFGKKASRAYHKGIKVVADHAGQVADVADKVSGVAGTLATGAAMIGLEPVAAASKGISKVADVAESASKGMMAAESAVKSGRDAIDNIRSGNFQAAASNARAAKNFGEAAMIRGQITKSKIERNRKK